MIRTPEGQSASDRLQWPLDSRPGTLERAFDDMVVSGFDVRGGVQDDGRVDATIRILTQASSIGEVLPEDTLAEAMQIAQDGGEIDERFTISRDALGDLQIRVSGTPDLTLWRALDVLAQLSIDHRL